MAENDVEDTNAQDVAEDVARQADDEARANERRRTDERRNEQRRRDNERRDEQRQRREEENEADVEAAESQESTSTARRSARQQAAETANETRQSARGIHSVTDARREEWQQRRDARRERSARRVSNEATDNDRDSRNGVGQQASVHRESSRLQRSARSGARAVDALAEGFAPSSESEEARRDEETSRVEVADSQDAVLDDADDNDTEEFPAVNTGNIGPENGPEMAIFGRDDGVELSSAEVRKAAENQFRDRMADANPFIGANATKSAKASVNMGNTIHQMYARELVRACVRDLDADVSLKTITSALTTAAVMWTLSPAFRDLTNDLGDRARAKVSNYLDETRDKARSSKIGQAFLGSQSKYEQAVAEANRDAANSAKFQQACMSATDTVPMSLHSASMTYLSLQENAYDAVRSGTNPALVDSKLSEMLKEYSTQWSVAGVEMPAVIDHSRTLVAQRGAEDPSYFAKFDNYGWAETSPGSVPENGKWKGHWVRANGQIIDHAELPNITYRRPDSVTNQIQQMGTSVAASLLGVYERKGPEAFQDALVGVNLGFDPQTCVYFDSQSQPGDPDGAGAMMRRRGQTMTAALIDDGLSSEEIMAFKDTMMEGVMDALYNVSPDIKKLCADQQFMSTTIQRIADVKQGYVERAQKGAWDSNMIPTRSHVQIREGIGRSEAAAQQGVALITPEGTPVGFDGQGASDQGGRDGAHGSERGEGDPQMQMSQKNEAPDPERRRGKPDWQKDMGEKTSIPDNATSYNDFAINKSQKHEQRARQSDYGFKGRRSVKPLKDNQETAFVDELSEGHSSRSRNTARRQRIVTTNQTMNNEEEAAKAAKKQAEMEM